MLGRWRVIRIHSFPALLDWQSPSFPNGPNPVNTGTIDNSEFLGKLTDLQHLWQAAVATPLRVVLHSTVKKWKPRQSQRGNNSISSAALWTEGKGDTVREGRARELLFTLSRRSQFQVASGFGSPSLQAGGNPQTLHIPQVNQFFQPPTARTHFHVAPTIWWAGGWTLKLPWVQQQKWEAKDLRKQVSGHLEFVTFFSSVEVFFPKLRSAWCVTWAQ